MFESSNKPVRFVIRTFLTLVLFLATLSPTGMVQGQSKEALSGESPPSLAELAAKQPRYTFPVEAAGKIWYPACHHDYPATDIFVAVGSRFVAPIAGIVDYVSYKDTWDPKVDDPATRGGLSVAIIGNDGVRYYGSHLSAVAKGIKPGARVQKGQLLGRTGKTGSARSTDPHLHFGISHPTTPDDWKVRRGEVDPYPYLNKWRKGVDATPDLRKTDAGVC